MGEVVLARDGQLNREVAIKRLRAAEPNDRQIARFLREARIQGRPEHPAIPPVHELGRDATGRPYFAMKRLSGVTLAAVLAEQPASVTRARLLRAFAEVCLAVEFAHTRGVLHRDLKPENIMLGEFGEVYVLDWGVAKVVGDGPEADAELASGDAEGVATIAGQVIGTPGYMAPEQLRGEADLDARADVYALGCVLFEILAGEPLHPRRRGADAPPPPTARSPGVDVPPELEQACARATAAERADRFATARELGEHVQRYLDGDRDVARPHDLAAAALAEANTGPRRRRPRARDAQRRPRARARADDARRRPADRRDDARGAARAAGRGRVGGRPRRVRRGAGPFPRRVRRLLRLPGVLSGHRSCAHRCRSRCCSSR